jgi:hypothetical protein
VASGSSPNPQPSDKSGSTPSPQINAVGPGLSGTEQPIAGNFKDTLLTDIRRSNPVLYNTLVAQAQRMEVADDRIVLTFTAAQKITPTFEKYRPVLEGMATKLAGRKITVVSDVAAALATADDQPSPASVDVEKRKSALREQALADAGVQALLEVFPAEIRDVEEM